MTDASNNECHRCGRRFARREHLQRHERSHTKEKPFGCSSCSKTFTRKDLLTRHNRIYHSQQGTGTTRVHDNFQAAVDNADQTSYPGTEPSADATRNGSVLTQDCHYSEFILPRDTRASFFDPSVTSVGFETLPTAQNLNDVGIWTPDFEYTGFPTSHEGDEFSNFVDSIALPSSVFSPSYQPVPDWPSESSFPTQVAIPEPQRIRHSENDAEADTLGEEATPWASRMPSVQPQEPQGGFCKGVKHATRQSLAQVTHQCRESMVQKLKPYSSIIPTAFMLPSRHTLTGFITGYVTVFNEHYPLLHLPTMELESLSLELFLSIAALGAQYYWERAKGFELFHVARTVAYERLRSQASQKDPPKMGNGDVLQLSQALILLIAVSTWSEAGKGEAFSLRSLLEEVLQADALDVKTPTENSSWLDWKRYEEVKRTKLIAYAFFNLHTITFDVPPMMLYRDIDLNLASSEKIWRANNVDTWHQLKEKEPSEISFCSAFHALFQDVNDERVKIPSVSPLSGHILMHAIIQHIWLLQQAGNLPIRQSIASTTAAASVELALKRWRQCSEPDHVKISDNSLPDGPMPFTSRALLRLAYIRLNIESGSARSIATWNPVKIAKSLFQQPAVQRGDKMTKAALHCAQGLGIPVKLGINFVAHTQVFYWSNQYALCSLECALLLTKWLNAATTSNPNPKLTDQEKKLLDFVVQLVNHTEYEASREKLLQNNKYLSIVILRVWAKLFRAEAVWQIVDLIGKSLEAYADLLEEDMDHYSQRTEST